jgi:hypothetical protein
VAASGPARERQTKGALVADALRENPQDVVAFSTLMRLVLSSMGESGAGERCLSEALFRLRPLRAPRGRRALSRTMDARFGAWAHCSYCSG